jgi:hypothetical protein
MMNYLLDSHSSCQQCSNLDQMKESIVRILHYSLQVAYLF